MGTLQYLDAALEGLGQLVCAGTARYILAVHVWSPLTRKESMGKK
jgi:hypothetical protein